MENNALVWGHPIPAAPSGMSSCSKQPCGSQGMAEVQKGTETRKFTDSVRAWDADVIPSAAVASQP